MHLHSRLRTSGHLTGAFDEIDVLEIDRAFGQVDWHGLNFGRERFTWKTRLFGIGDHGAVDRVHDDFERLATFVDHDRRGRGVGREIERRAPDGSVVLCEGSLDRAGDRERRGADCAGRAVHGDLLRETTARDRDFVHDRLDEHGSRVDRGAAGDGRFCEFDCLCEVDLQSRERLLDFRWIGRNGGVIDLTESAGGSHCESDGGCEGSGEAAKRCEEILHLWSFLTSFLTLDPSGKWAEMLASAACRSGRES